ncbi:MAG: c-type cytochrome [Loktanella sp.]|nr:c-type cytochrome [Loktanella sp.]
MQKYFIFAALALTAACVDEDPMDGRSAYLDNCASCHAADGTGNGPMARELGVIAPDLTQISARNGGTFPRDAVMSTIDGYEASGHLTGAMPEFGAGDMGETVIVENNGLGTPVPLKLLVLTDYVESLQR